MVEQFRLRMTDVELKFLIKTLEDIIEGSDMVLSFERTLPRNDPRVIRERRRRYVAKELQRKYQSILVGKKKHMRSMALLLCSMLVDE